MRDKCFSLFLICAYSLLMVGCYKKELDEFKKVSFKTERDLAFPLFESNLTLNDSIPLTIPAVTLADTIKVDLRAGSILSNYSGKMDYVEFKLGLKSNFPVLGNLQIYFVEENGKIVDSLFTYENTIVDGSPGGTYNETIISSYMDHEKYKKIENTPKLYLRYKLKTFPSTLYSSNELQIKSGIRFGLTF